MEGRLNGEILTSDPVPQSGNVVQVHTELAWEMEASTLQQHRLQRTPIKLQVCVCVCVYVCVCVVCNVV